MPENTVVLLGIILFTVTSNNCKRLLELQCKTLLATFFDSDLGGLGKMASRLSLEQGRKFVA